MGLGREPGLHISTGFNNFHQEHKLTLKHIILFCPGRDQLAPQVLCHEPSLGALDPGFSLPAHRTKVQTRYARRAQACWMKRVHTRRCEMRTKGCKYDKQEMAAAGGR